MEESLVYAVKAIDRASPALYGVARSMKMLQRAAFQTQAELGRFAKVMPKLHHSAFQSRDELGRFQKATVLLHHSTHQARDSLGRFQKVMPAVESSSKKVRSELGRVDKSMDNVRRSTKQGRDEMGRFQKTLGQKIKVGIHQGFTESFRFITRGAQVAWRGINTFIRGTIRAFRAAARWAWNLYKRILMLVAAMAALGAAALAAGFAIATKQAAAFELASAKVRGVTGATAAEIKVLDATMRELAKTSIYTAGQFYEAGYFLASAGFSPDQIQASIQGVTKLAEALGADLGQATATVVATLSAYNMAASESTRISNVFAAANAASQANMEKLSSALVYAAPITGALNVRFEETVATLNLLFNAGLRGMMAGRSLSSMIGKLLAPTKESSKALKELGLTMEDIDPRTKGLAGAFAALFDASITTGQAIKFFGQENIKAFEILRTAGAPAIAAMEQQITGTNQAFEQAAIQMDTLANRWKYLVSSLQELGLVFGAPLTRPLKNALKLIADFVNWLSETKEIRGLAAAIGKGFDALASSIRKALANIQKNWDDVWANIWSVIKFVATGIAGVVGGLIALVQYLVQAYERGGGVLQQIWQFIVDVHVKAAQFIVRVFNGIKSAFLGIFSGDVAEAVPRAMFEIMRAVGQIVMQLGNEAFAAFVNIVQKYMNPIIAQLKTTFKVLAAAADALGWDSMADRMRKAMNNIDARIEETTDKSRKEWSAAIRAWFQDLKYEDVVGGVGKIGESLRKAISGTDAGKDFLKGFDAEVSPGLEEMVRGMFGERTTKKGGGIFGAITGGMQAGQSWIQPFLRGVEDFQKAVQQAGDELGDGAGGAAGIPGGAKALQISEKLLKYMDELNGVLGEMLGPLALLERQMEYTRIHIAQLDDSIERQTAAMEANTDALRSGMKERWEKMPIEEMEKWARLHIAKTLHQQMHPQTLEYLVPGHRQLSEDQLIRALMKRPMYMDEVENALMRMTHGEMRGAAETEWEKYTTKMLDYQEQMVQYQQRQLEIQREALAAQMAALERQKEAMLSQEKLAALLLEMEKFKVAMETEGVTIVKEEWDKIIERVKALYDKVQGPTDVPGGGAIPGAIPGATSASVPPAPPPTFGPGMITPADPGKGTILIPGTSGKFPINWPGDIAGRSPYTEPIAPMIPPPGSTFGPIDPIARRPNTIIIGPNGIDIQIVNPPDATPEDIANAVADGMADFVEESGIAMGAAGLPAR